MHLQDYLSLLFDLMLKSTAVLLLALLITRLWRGAAAASRHLVWVAAFGVLAVLPFVFTPDAGHSVKTPADARGMIVIRVPVTPEPVRVIRHSALTATPVTMKRSLFAWRDLTASLWIGGIVVLLALRAASGVRLWRLRKRIDLITDERLTKLGERLAGEAGIGRDVELRMSKECRVAMTWGTWRPVILLPTEAQIWAEERLAMVLRHELAHVKRADYLTRLCSQAVCAVYWPNPLVWLGARRLRFAQEQACDDCVLMAGVPAEFYAMELVVAVRDLRGRGFGAAVSMAEPSTLEGRVLGILGEGRNRRGLRRSTVMLTAAAVGLTLAGCSAVAVRDAQQSAVVTMQTNTPEEPLAASEPVKFTGPLVTVITRFVELKNEDVPKLLLDLRAVEGAKGSLVEPAILTSDELDAVMKKSSGLALNLLSAPSVTMYSGQPGTMQVGQEMRHPAQWEKDPAGSGWQPTDFVTRTIGVEMTMRPQVNADGTIALEVKPKVTEFEGFIEHATPPVELQVTPQGKGDGRVQLNVKSVAEAVVPTANTASGAEAKSGAPHLYLQPVFSVREVQATVSRLVSGRTVVLRVGERKTTEGISAKGQSPEVKAEESLVTMLVFVTAIINPEIGEKAVRDGRVE
jgi:beta-lactamase regulating signal transducer with metallopeptidase domain